MLGRKRVRSAECPFIGQSKHFINQTIVDSHDAEKMTLIYSKTVSMLFKGANQPSSQPDSNAAKADIDNNNLAKVTSGSSSLATTSPKPEDRIKEVRLLGNGQFVPIVGGSRSTSLIPPKPDLICVGCSRDSCLQGLCQNCDLDLCETCGLGCSDCGAPLCTNCVNLFGCGTADNPCCSRCKMFVGN